MRKLPEFAYDEKQSFRGWLRTILMNRWRNRQRRRPTQPLDDGEEPAGVRERARSEWKGSAAEFDKSFPRGYFGHRSAFSSDGK